MTTETTGIVVDGQLQLDRPLPLPNNSRVAVIVKTAADLPDDWRERFAKGLQEWREYIRQHPVRSGGVKFTREELHERR
jgi:hypothetical protein